MPEAAIDKYSDSRAREQNIGSCSDGRIRPSVDAEAKASTMELGTKLDFGPSVPTPEPAHAARDVGCRRGTVTHKDAIGTKDGQVPTIGILTTPWLLWKGTVDG